MTETKSRSPADQASTRIKGKIQKTDVPFPWMVQGTVSYKSDGTCNVVVIVPHGHPHNDLNAGKLGAYVAEHLDSFAVINRLYRRPSKDRPWSLKDYLMDLNVPSQARECAKDYWNPIINFIKEINQQHGRRALLFFIHGMSDKKADALEPAPDIVVGKGFIPQEDDPSVGKYDAKAASASEAFFEKLLDGMRNMCIVRDDVPGYTGRDKLPYHLYAERKKLGIYIEAVQLEFRFRGFRDTPENQKGRGQELAAVIESTTPLFKSWRVEELAPIGVQLIPADRFQADIKALRRATRIANDRGQEVDFSGEAKENFIKLYQSAYRIMNRMATALNEGGRLLSEVRQTLKPQGLFSTWIRYTGMPESTVYNYLRVYDRFGSHLPELSHLGMKKLLIASGAPNCVDYVKNNEQTIAKEPAEALLRRISELRATRKKKIGRGPTGIRGSR